MQGIWASVRHPEQGFIGAALLMVHATETPMSIAETLVEEVLGLGMEAGEIVAFEVPEQDVAHLVQLGMPINRMVTQAELTQLGVMMALVEVNPDAVGQMPLARGTGTVH